MANGWFSKRKGPPAGSSGSRTDAVPEGLWTQCEKCRELLLTKDWERNLKVCNKCGYHSRLGARERIAMLLDPGSFVEQDAGLGSVNPLNFPKYADSLAKYQKLTGLRDAILSGEGVLAGSRLGIAATDPYFMVGSMGSVVGERITRTVERSTQQRLPVLLVSGSGGGARMQEGLLSLMQMAKTSAAIARHHQAGLLTVVLITDPSLAGIMASWGSLGDVLVAEPGARIGFVGERVSKQQQVTKVPTDFQTAEYQLAHGQVDVVVPRKELREFLTTLLRFAAPTHAAAVEAGAETLAFRQ